LSRVPLLQQYWVSSQPYKHIAVKDIAESFKTWKVGKSNAKHLATPYPKERSHPASLVTTPYALNMVAELKALMRRELTLVQRTMFIYVMKTIQVIYPPPPLQCTTSGSTNHVPLRHEGRPGNKDPPPPNTTAGSAIHLCPEDYPGKSNPPPLQSIPPTGNLPLPSGANSGWRKVYIWRQWLSGCLSSLPTPMFFQHAYHN